MLQAEELCNEGEKLVAQLRELVESTKAWEMKYPGLVKTSHTKKNREEKYDEEEKESDSGSKN